MTPEDIYIGDVIEFTVPVTDPDTADLVDLPGYAQVRVAFALAQAGAAAFLLTPSAVAAGSCTVTTAPGQLNVAGGWRLQVLAYRDVNAAPVVYNHSTEWGFEVLQPLA